MSEGAAQLSIPPEATWGPTFDVGRATDAYIATVPAADRARSDAYFEGGYWIELWSTVVTVAACALLLRFRFAARLRDFAAARGAGPFVQALAVAAGFFAALAVLTLPWALYTQYFREHQYGMSNYTMGGYLGEWALFVAINTAFLGLVVAGLYRLVRRVRERWVWWATAATSVIILFVFMVQPVVLDPLFNDYEPLPSGAVRDSILALAHETGIPVDDVYWFDASRQTKRISANVSGLGGTARIALNDNLLNGASLPEIRAVMGHEMGHYRLHHGLELAAAFTLILGVGYFVINRLFGRWQRRHGERLGIRDLADPAGLPLAFAIFSVAIYLLTPVTNTMVRAAEAQADAYGLDAAKEPHGFASVAMRLSAYRKLEPGALEEAIFYDHPSGRARVSRSMRWIAAHPPP
ncbi:MAG TPA: M48 family metallopeptidase [Steroidobacteraceae bacterium]|nr:M48 family metallopeptidase [Steroidobacteraceae bacterium]